MREGTKLSRERRGSETPRGSLPATKFFHVLTQRFLFQVAATTFGVQHRGPVDEF